MNFSELYRQFQGMMAAGLSEQQACAAMDAVLCGSKKRPSRAAKEDRTHPLPKDEADWLTSDLAKFALAELGDPGTARRVTDAFRNYWLSIGGTKARKVDWGLTYKNWVMREADKRGRSGQRAPIPPARQNGSDTLQHALDNLVPRR